MMNNQREVSIMLKRIDLCDLMLACTIAYAYSGNTPEERNGKWLVIHNKIKYVLDKYDREVMENERTAV